MKQNEARQAYPNKFIVFESLNQFEDNNVLTITDLSIIDVFDELGEAFKRYSKLHKEDKKRPLNIGDTTKET